MMTAHASGRRGLSAVLAVVLTSLASGGCVKEKLITFARYERGAEPLTHAAPAGGIYRVKWAADRGDDMESVVESKRIVGPGDTLGFRTGTDGRVYAVAGGEQFPLDRMPRKARYCAWSYKYEEETRFARAMTKAGEVVVVGALLAGVVAAEVGLASLDDGIGDDCYEDDGDAQQQKEHRDRDRPRKRKKGGNGAVAGDGE